MIKTKEYENYQDYLNHQLEKTTSERVRKEEEENFDKNVDVFKKVFSFWIKENKIKIKNTACLGARSGAEVKALIELGANSIGFDLQENLPLVRYGDIHNIPEESLKYDFVFSNVFDHSLYPDKFAKEIERILKPGGYILLQLAIGDSDDSYKANEIFEISDILKLFKSSKIISKKEITWRGSINTEMLLIKNF